VVSAILCSFSQLLYTVGVSCGSGFGEKKTKKTTSTKNQNNKNEKINKT